MLGRFGFGGKPLTGRAGASGGYWGLYLLDAAENNMEAGVRERCPSAIVRAAIVLIRGEAMWSSILAYLPAAVASVALVFAPAMAQACTRVVYLGADGDVITAPYVSKAIPGGKAQISGSFNQQSATELANFQVPQLSPARPGS